MKTKILSILFWLAPYTCAICDTPKKPAIIIIEPGVEVINKEELLNRKRNTNGHWMALFYNGKKWDIKCVKVTTTSSLDKNSNCPFEIGKADLDILQLAVWSPECPNAILFLRNFKPPKNGIIAAENDIFQKPNSNNLPLSSWTYKTRFKSTQITLCSVKHPQIPEFFTLCMLLNNRQLKINNLEGQYQSIKWIGDLDGDGKIDLITSWHSEDGPFGCQLFLSSLSPKHNQLCSAAIQYAYSD